VNSHHFLEGIEIAQIICGQVGVEYAASGAGGSRAEVQQMGKRVDFLRNAPLSCINILFHDVCGSGSVD